LAKILGISASRRPRGNCETSVKVVLASAGEGGADTDFLRLTDFSIEACAGCFKCIRGDRRCPIEDDLYALLGYLDGTDGLVLAAPVYFLSPPAVLVGLLDRLLTVGQVCGGQTREKPAVTMTLMGNREWRGVTEPFVNLTASLLGFEVVRSMRLVAEGPGEIVTRDDVIHELEQAGLDLAGGAPDAEEVTPELCPVCRSDCFRIEPPSIVCPICGSAGDLMHYVERQEFVGRLGEPRWGLSWLDKHIEAWVRPSIERYRDRRKAILRAMGRLKQHRGVKSERGNADVR
jgi:multimeric flavodoxin WrbA